MVKAILSMISPVMVEPVGPKPVKAADGATCKFPRVRIGQ